MNFFISDLHIGDENILTYEHRPFKSLDEMRKTIIDNWNTVVRNTDTVYLLGDIGDATILTELKGNIFIICGNHDNYIDLNENYNVDVSQYPIMVDNMWLSHEPIGYVPPECPYVNVHGHLHRFQYGLIGRTWAEGNRYFNVSVENINYTPITKKEIAKRMGYKGV